MGLQIWLPLNGDLHNQGLSDITVTNHGATIDNSGKIGKCYSFDGSDDYIDINCNKLYNIFSGGSQQFSVAFWVYHADATRAIIFGDYGLTGGIGFNIELTTSHGVRFYWNGSPDKNFNSTYIHVEASGWTHICLTYDGNQIQVYKDGIVSIDIYNGALATKTKTSGTFYLGRDFRTGTTALNGKLNDFRIYDHCLSAKEVEEIAKGLVLHYKLSNNINTGQNIMPNSLDMPFGSANATTGTWRLAGTSNMTQTRVAIIDTPDGNGYGFQNSGIQTANDGSCYGIDNFPLEANTIYTISMWARIIEGTEGYAGFHVYYINSEISGSHSKIDKNYRVTALDKSGEWTQCWYTFLTNSVNTRNIYIGITTGDTQVTTQMCNVHIQKGLIFNSNIIYDLSGYKNNGYFTDNSKITYLYNTPKYQNCVHSIKSKIVSNEPLTFLNKENPEFTVTFWVKIFSNETYTSYTDLIYFADNYDIGQGGFRLELCGSPVGDNLMWFRGPTNQNAGGKNMNSSSGSNWFNKDKWHHIAFSYNKNNNKYISYLDGYQCGTFNAVTDWYPTGTFYLGDTQSTTADFSDLRFFATTLTDAQILELYNTSMSIDNQGNTHARELVE